MVLGWRRFISLVSDCVCLAHFFGCMLTNMECSVSVIVVDTEMKNGVTDSGLRVLAEAGCGANLTSLTLASECFTVCCCLMGFKCDGH